MCLDVPRQEEGVPFKIPECLFYSADEEWIVLPLN